MGFSLDHAPESLGVHMQLTTATLDSFWLNGSLGSILSASPCVGRIGRDPSLRRACWSLFQSGAIGLPPSRRLDCLPIAVWLWGSLLPALPKWRHWAPAIEANGLSTDRRMALGIAAARCFELTPLGSRHRGDWIVRRSPYGFGERCCLLLRTDAIGLPPSRRMDCLPIAVWLWGSLLPVWRSGNKLCPAEASEPRFRSEHSQLPTLHLDSRRYTPCLDDVGLARSKSNNPLHLLRGQIAPIA
jgi:hypothetical protein